MAGTCIVFTVKEGQECINTEKLADIEMSGIGERTAEGYGQICFNDPLLTEPGLKKCKKLEKDSAYNSDNLSKRKLSEKDTDFNYARIIEKIAWQDTIHKAALFLANDKDSRYNILGIKLETEEGKQEKISKPSMSQMGSLRSILSKLKSPSDETVNSWIKNRRDKWFQENDVSRKSLNKISDLVTKDNNIWEYLNDGLEKIKHPKFSEIVITKEGESFLKNNLWVDAVKILVDACIRAHKRELEESRNKGVGENGASDRI
jgi:CRISPR-associated protein Csx10